MSSFFEKTEKCFQNIFGLVGIIMILIETYSVLARNVLKITSAGTDEMLKLLFVWSIFICSALAFLSDDLIGLNLVEERLSTNKKAFGTIKIVQYIFALVLSVFLVIQSIEMLQTQIMTAETTPVLQYPLWIINTGFFLGAVLTVGFAVYKIIECRKYFKAE